MTKKTDLYKTLPASKKKQYNDRYNKLIHATYILGTLSGELLTKAIIISSRE